MVELEVSLGLYRRIQKNMGVGNGHAHFDISCEACFGILMYLL